MMTRERIGDLHKMITYHLDQDHTVTAEILRNRELEEQQLHVRLILDVIHETIGNIAVWEKHPVVRLWRGYEAQLAAYGLVMCDEWESRGHEPLSHGKMRTAIAWHLDTAASVEDFVMEKPPWMEDREIFGMLMLSHQSLLVHKAPKHYRKYFPDVTPSTTPYWPVRAEDD